MRKPRLEAFDPHYRMRQPETIDVAGVVPINPRLIDSDANNVKPNPANDEQLLTRAERIPKGESGTAPLSNDAERYSVRNTERSEIRSVEGYQIPLKRKTKRYSFEFFDDQLIRLKKIKASAEMTGENVSLSAIVREALDIYLKARDL